MEQRTVIKVEASFGDALCDTIEEIQLHCGREIPAKLFELLNFERVVIQWEGFKFQRVMYPQNAIPESPFTLDTEDLLARFRSHGKSSILRLKCLRAMGFEAYLDETP